MPRSDMVNYDIVIDRSHGASASSLMLRSMCKSCQADRKNKQGLYLRVALGEGESGVNLTYITGKPWRPLRGII